MLGPGVNPGTAGGSRASFLGPARASKGLPQQGDPWKTWLRELPDNMRTNQYFSSATFHVASPHSHSPWAMSVLGRLAGGPHGGRLGAAQVD